MITKGLSRWFLIAAFADFDPADNVDSTRHAHPPFPRRSRNV